MTTLGNRNLYPVGFMGSGKDKVGNILATRMDRDIINTDALIVEREGMTVNQIFDIRGEKYFRDSETRVVEEMCLRQRLIVSTGGGAFCQRRNRGIMLASGVVVWLDVDLRIIQERLRKKEDRPLARDPTKMAELFWQRRELYGRAHVHVRVHVEVPPEEVAERVLHAIGWK